MQKKKNLYVQSYCTGERVVRQPRREGSKRKPWDALVPVVGAVHGFDGTGPRREGLEPGFPRSARRPSHPGPSERPQQTRGRSVIPVEWRNQLLKTVPSVLPVSKRPSVGVSVERGSEHLLSARSPWQSEPPSLPPRGAERNAN